MVTTRIVWMVALICAPLPVLAAGAVEPPKQQEWAFDGVFGRFDKPAIQRGLQVYKEVCASCHGLKRVAFRTLEGVGFSDAEVKSLAAEYTIIDGPNDEGEMYERPGRASDKFPSPHANEQAARAINNGAYPLDLSLISKARADGPNYLFSLLTGYADAPAYACEKVNADGKCVGFSALGVDTVVPETEDASAEEIAAKEQSDMGRVFYCSDIVHGIETNAKGDEIHTETCTEMGKNLHYNPYFPGKQIAMPSPINADGLVEYQDGTNASVEQMSKDLVTFLQWAAEPEMEQRKHMGVKVMIFLVAFTVLFYLAKKRIWSRIH